MAEINVTPFIDVVLVLLIIFMLTAAVVEFGMRVSVPPTRTAAAPKPGDPSLVQILRDGRLALNGKLINLYDIVPRAKQENPDQPKVYVRIHRLAAWNTVAQVLAECKAGGIEVNLVPAPIRLDPKVSR
jgi:biopolymer transport protein ExbD